MSKASKLGIYAGGRAEREERTSPSETESDDNAKQKSGEQVVAKKGYNIQLSIISS